MPAKRNASPKESSSTATIGFEAKLWLTADSRSAAETTEGNRSNNMDAAEPSAARQTATGSPKGERGGAHQYFLTRFASAEGKNGGPAKCEVQSASVEVKKSRPFGIPCSIRHSKFVLRHPPLLAIRGIEADFGPEHADTVHPDLHPDLRADYVLANPPFNDSDWFRKDDDQNIRYAPSRSIHPWCETVCQTQ